MTINPDKLPLTSPLWNGLGNFAVPAERIPLIIRKLLEGAVDPDARELDELAAAIFHQYSVADATFVVVPYLPEIHARYGETNPSLFYLAANIAAVAEVDDIGLPPPVQRGFFHALREFEAIAISRIPVAGQAVDEIYGVTTAAIAFSRHCCGKLLTDALNAEDTSHTSVICPRCRQQFRVMLFDQGAVVMENGVEPIAPDPPVPLAAPSTQPHRRMSHNAWQVVSAFLAQKSSSLRASDIEQLHVGAARQVCELGIGPDAPPGGVFSVIAAILMMHGFSANARRFLRLWDTLTCPSCGAAFVAADRWWGCVPR
jgi:hypothetical protein